MQEAIAATGVQVFTERDALGLVRPLLDKLRAAPVEDRIEFVFEAFRHLGAGGSLSSLNLALNGITASLLRQGLPLNPVQAVLLVELASRPRETFPFKSLLTCLATVHRTEALKVALLQLRACIDEWHGQTFMRDVQERIDALAQGPKQPVGVAESGAWTKRVFAEIQTSERQAEWLELFGHARSLTQSTPANKWREAGTRYIDSVGRVEFVAAAQRWLAWGPMPDESPQHQVPDDEADYQKGFVWLAGLAGEPALAAPMADFALQCLRKIAMIGAVSQRVGNACVGALAAMPGFAPVAQLSRLAGRVKYDVARRLIEKAMTEAAERNHVTRDDLEAMSVPAYGLNADGERVEPLGECLARLAISGSSVSLSWSRAGQPLKAPPAALKASHAANIKELQRLEKELGGVLAAQRLRLERLLMSTDSTQFDKWREWYLDNPVVAAVASRLIWIFEREGTQATGFALSGGQIVDWAGNAVATDSATRVRLWHPIHSDVPTVMAWRCWLEDRAIQQPFKQAHREVYILTDAERATETYSNRFAAHILKQHQFAALTRERGWQFTLMGEWDSHNTPSLELARHQIRAEFYVDFPPDAGGRHSAEITAHAVYKLIRSDRVRFCRLGSRDRRGLDPDPPLRLDDVPPVVFSEVMRDVDLFIGVASIGSDPAWSTTARAGQHLDYWHGFTCGELTEAAHTRRDLLTRLLSRFAALRDRCSLDGRFLVVRGRLHEYRIHLGSANVFMEPGSRYLCIVQGGGEPALFLPFEGDRILSLILSKAVLLLEDSSIKDETILRQIRGDPGPF